MKKRTLLDLYVRGTEVEFDDGQGEPVLVYLKKLNPAENERAVRLANAARARVIAEQRDPQSEASVAVESELAEYDREAMVDYSIAEDLLNKRESIEAELAGDEKSEWAKDSYLQGLRDAWVNGMRDRWIADNEDEEANRVFEEMSRFSSLVDEKLKSEREAAVRDLEDEDDEILRTTVKDRLFKLRAELAWVDEYRRAQLWLAVRDPKDRKQQLLADRSDVDALETDVLLKLLQELRAISVEVDEGKDLQETPSS